MKFQARPKLRDDLIVRQVEDDFVVYDPIIDRIALLNISAAAVLDLCDGTHTVDEIANEIAIVFSKEPRDIREDIEVALKDFMMQGFLETAGNVQD